MHRIIIDNLEDKAAAVCQLCGDVLFETDPELSEEHGSTVWSHLTDTNCDDPTPKEE